MTFSGEIADYYAAFRRGFDEAALAFVGQHLGLGTDSVVVDLGCGTGQLGIPLAARVRHVLGLDPEPDMLAHAHREAVRRSVGPATSWQLGTHEDVPAITCLVGECVVDALTISNAAHFVDMTRLASTLPRLLRPGGTIGIIANGIPIWRQDSPWSAALAEFICTRFDTDLSGSRYTDERTLVAGRDALESAGLTTTRSAMRRTVPVTVDWLAGNMFSAMPAGWLPARDDHAAFVSDLAAALRAVQPTGPFLDDAGIDMVVGTRARDRAPG